MHRMLLMRMGMPGRLHRGLPRKGGSLRVPFTPKPRSNIILNEYRSPGAPKQHFSTTNILPVKRQISLIWKR